MSESLTKIDKFLFSLSDFEYRLVVLTIENSKLINSIQKQFVISDKEMAKRLGISMDKLKKMKRGACDYDLKYLAKLEMIAKEEIERSQLVQIRMSEVK